MKPELRIEYVKEAIEDLKESGALFAMDIIYAEPISVEKSLKMMDIREKLYKEMQKIIEE